MIDKHARATVRLRRAQRTVLELVLVSAFVAAPLLLAGHPFTASLAFLAGLLAAPIVLRPRMREAHRVGVNEVGLTADGALVVPRHVIASAVVVPGERARLVVTRTNGATIEVELDDVDDARALLRALGFDAQRVTADVQVVAPMLATPLRCLTAAASFSAMLYGTIFALATGHTGAVLAMTAASFAFLFAMVPAHVTVGTDAIVWRWLGMRRIVPLDGALRAEARPRVVRLHRRDGSHTDIHVGMPGGTRASEQPVAMLAERINAAIAARTTNALGTDALALARGDRSPREWVASLRASLTAEAGFRKAPMMAERLWALVESAAASPSSRAAAAVALAPGLDDSGRTRIRVAARASASPKLRVALEAASETSTDDDALAEALASLEASSSSSR